MSSSCPMNAYQLAGFRRDILICYKCFYRLLVFAPFNASRSEQQKLAQTVWRFAVVNFHNMQRRPTTLETLETLRFVQIHAEQWESVVHISDNWHSIYLFSSLNWTVLFSSPLRYVYTFLNTFFCWPVEYFIRNWNLFHRDKYSQLIEFMFEIEFTHIEGVRTSVSKISDRSIYSSFWCFHGHQRHQSRIDDIAW